MYPINIRRHPSSSALQGWRHNNSLKDAQSADTVEYGELRYCMVYSADRESGVYAFIHPS